MKRLCCVDERLVASILCARSKAQLDNIDQLYRVRYNRTLKEYIERELGGNLEKFLSYTQMTEPEFDSYILNKAFSGIGSDKEVIIEVFCTRPYERLRQMRYDL